MPRLSKIGSAALAAFGWTGLSSVTADFLVVAGGGGGATAFGAGGGAGGYRTSVTGQSSGGGASAEAKLSLNPTLSYTVIVGAGGNGALGSTQTGNTNGGNSSFLNITSTGGGAAGSNGVAGATGGSGGAGGNQGGISAAAGAGTANQGYAGGTGSGSSSYGSGGGGGAGAIGGTGTTSACGAGGVGVSSPISGTSTFYAGGGGGGATSVFGITTPGNGGNGGGGKGADSTNSWVGYAGSANTGGGGGGGGYTGSWQNGGAGGSGVVIISYVGAQQFGGGVVTSSGGNTIHTFTTSGTLSPLSSLTANFLVVAGGGGGGGNQAGGGGAGGLRSSVTATGGGGSLESALTIDTNSTYLVTVGAGGAGNTSASRGTSGGDSAFLNITSTGGGGGGGTSAPSEFAGAAGGSGGGAAQTGAIGAGTANQGFAGGLGNNSGNLGGGGGGGAFAVGAAGTSTAGGNGGAGVSVSITGSSVTYAGGGGGGTYNGGTAGTGGAGGGANGNSTTPATANTGGGGGGGSNTPVVGGSSGGSGVVIISYPGATQQMAGGTVTVAGGNVIHTFTSSGYLAPIYSANNSLRFRSSVSAYLNRTPASAGNRRTWTWSGWVKRGALTTASGIMSAGTSANDWTGFRFNSDDTFAFYRVGPGGGTTTYLNTTQVFRDPSSWYHIVLQWDTTQATSSNRIKLYINGVQVTAFASSSYPTLNYEDAFMNTAIAHLIGNITAVSQFFDGYMTEINFIDGQALTPNSFGTSNGLGVWQPIRYGGSYGTNGFYLPFTNTTSTTTLGYDFSPNGNNWTTNNISLTAGSTYDSMTDVPTLTSTTAANYCVLNTLDGTNMGYITVSNANLTYTEAASGNGFRAIRGTIGVTTGKYRFSVYGTIAASTRMNLGLCISTTDLGSYFTSQDIGVQYSPYDAVYYLNGASTSYGSTQRITAVFDFIFDAATGKCWVAVNGTLLGGNPDAGTGQMATFTTTSPVFPVTQGYGGPWDVNFGQRPWDYTISTASSFVALNTFNLTTPTIGATAATTANKYMDASIRSGAGGSSVTVTGIQFAPDFVWTKARNAAYEHMLADTVRGATKALRSDLTAAELTADSWGYLSAFNSDGYTAVAGSANFNSYGASGITYVDWMWKANGAGSTNTAGSITSTVSANTTAGFSILTYTGNNTSGATVGHGLGVKPSFIVVKKRTGTDGWGIYHTSLGATKTMELNTTGGEATSAIPWNNTEPTSSVIYLNGNNYANSSSFTYVMYCFAPIAGYSAFGSYTGNGSTDGPFVFTGFRPRFVMIKASSISGENWYIVDSTRSPYNAAILYLSPNSSGAESSPGAAQFFDFLSNGFKLRVSGSYANSSGTTYIYMAFAENPFKYANAR